ncbi:uncharacterized protein LOC143618836 [Bidens hawaiensis]|uniref:uncharacterized protein LOC143618836 n=1 Tax=Bidens hawaiensis TaxID=980011 RepID=UPI00404987CD
MSAYDAWSALEGLFQDNKNTRATYLLQKFATTRLNGFPNMSAYCQAIKSIADQLANVGTPLDNKLLVLHLLAGLTDAYEGISTILQHKDPIPSFHEARSQLCMIESQKAEKAQYAATIAGQALHTTTSKTTNQPTPPSAAQPDPNPPSARGRGRTRGRGRGRYSWSRGNPNLGRGQPYGHWTSPTTYAWTMPTPHPTSSSPPPWLPWSPPPPPCPYPTVPPPQNTSHSQGILGPRPHQGHQATYTPTDIQQALYTMSLNPPDYQHGVMDTGATISMDPNSGNFRTILNNRVNENIIVGNGTSIPVYGHGPQTFPKPYPPFVLNRVLYAPNLIRKLISVRQFTIDNSVSVEFDPFGFLVKDFKTRKPIIRCDSSGDLYTFSKDAHCFSTSTTAAQSSSLWHQRLGHPGPALLQSLKNSNSIVFSNFNKAVCEPCVFGKMMFGPHRS